MLYYVLLFTIAADMMSPSIFGLPVICTLSAPFPRIHTTGGLITQYTHWEI